MRYCRDLRRACATGDGRRAAGGGRRAADGGRRAEGGGTWAADDGRWGMGGGQRAVSGTRRRRLTGSPSGLQTITSARAAGPFSGFSCRLPSGHARAPPSGRHMAADRMVVVRRRHRIPHGPDYSLADITEQPRNATEATCRSLPSQPSPRCREWLAIGGGQTLVTRRPL